MASYARSWGEGTAVKEKVGEICERSRGEEWREVISKMASAKNMPLVEGCALQVLKGGEGSIRDTVTAAL